MIVIIIIVVVVIVTIITVNNHFYLTFPFYMVLCSNIFDINDIKTTQCSQVIFKKNVTCLFNHDHLVVIPAGSFGYFYCVTKY